MDEKFSSLKLKKKSPPLTTPSNDRTRNILKVEENKDGISTGHPIYISGMTIVINPYGGNINHVKLTKRLNKVNKFFQWQFNEEGEETTISQTRIPGPSSSRCYGALPEKRIALRRIDSSKCAREHPECAPKNAKDKPSKHVRERPEDMDRILQKKSKSEEADGMDTR